MVLICFPHENERTGRDYRVKFPDEIVHDNLPGQLWFGAECLAAGSNIVIILYFSPSGSDQSVRTRFFEFSITGTFDIFDLGENLRGNIFKFFY